MLISQLLLLYVDGNSSDGEHVWAIGLRENSFSYLMLHQYLEQLINLIQ